ncbi:MULTISPECIES: (d)CMP kinase [Enterococcaceae]|uniref:(d)CMP kinase n=1 Tax=Enterococcaceae TaxID=81852 RepID=UPI000E474110|nr:MULTISPECIES: (d)CMP kinase [Enterococcaceae]MCI0129619.1 (d)CMP kinase [Vagococcus sp. CY53-2]RGI31785.1 (d)CMP kinase [Melissococcus sp. OM08-11BH]UNM90264.1 (d)CMP kinase [Vagococcus sp. CY52-2]
MSKQIQVAIDGPASAGKSTVAKILAKKMGYIYCDTGAMYRVVTYHALEHKINLKNTDELMNALSHLNISFDYVEGIQHVYANGVDVTDAIRMPDVTNHVSEVAAIKEVRHELVNRQKNISASQNIVMDGRDIGTVVLPDADLKIFLVASVKERAERRYKENRTKGIMTSLDELQKEIEDRDYYDSHRKESPLVQANDAIKVDTTGLSIEEVVKVIENELKKVISSQNNR